jgi:hypothetical protein
MGKPLKKAHSYSQTGRLDWRDSPPLLPETDFMQGSKL